MSTLATYFASVLDHHIRPVATPDRRCIPCKDGATTPPVALFRLFLGVGMQCEGLGWMSVGPGDALKQPCSRTSTRLRGHSDILR